jgi:hypothetical protein
MGRLFLIHNGKKMNFNGDSLIIPNSSISSYSGNMTVGTFVFATITAYGYHPMWAQPGSLNPLNSDIFNITWADGGTNAEKIIITFIDNISSLGIIKFDDVEISFIIDNNTAISVNTFSSNPFNDVGEISTVNINYLLQ